MASAFPTENTGTVAGILNMTAERRCVCVCVRGRCRSWVKVMEWETEQAVEGG